MTNDTKVFCKDCKWIDVISGRGYYCKLEHKTTDTHHPVTGEISQSQSWMYCEIKNKNCNCPDFEPKEEDS